MTNTTNATKKKSQVSTLTREDLSDIVVKSGVPREWAEANCKRVTKDEATEEGFEKHLSGGILYKGRGGTPQLKPDVPWMDKRKIGKLKGKYISLPGSNYDAWIPNYPTGEDVWDDPDKLWELCLAVHGEALIVIVEGAKKAMALCAIGIPAISISGCTTGTRKGKRNPTTGEMEYELVPLIKHYAEMGFGFIFALDADCATKSGVIEGEKRTALAAIKFDVNVYSATGLWHMDEGKGVDDYLVNNNADKFKALLAKAVLERSWNRNHNVLSPDYRGEGKLPKADILAEEIALEYQGVFRFNPEINEWMHYCDNHKGTWKVEKEISFKAKINKILDSKNIRGYGTHSYIVNVVKELELLLVEKEWSESSPTEYLPFKNGVLEVSTRKLLKHSPEYRFTWCLPCDYDPFKTDYSKIDNFFNESTEGDKGLKDILECFANATLKGRHELQKALLLIGQGGTGKTIYLNLLSELVGVNNTCTTSLEHSNSSRFETSNYYGKRLILFGDEDKHSGKLGTFKELIGGGRLRNERKGKDAGEGFINKAMVAIAANINPFVGESSRAISRRLITVPFRHTPERVDIHLFDKLKSQLPALINYLLTLDDDFVTQTLMEAGNNPSINAMEAEQRERVDSVFWWMNENIIYDTSKHLQVGKDNTEADRNGLENCKTAFGHYYGTCKRAGKQPKAVTEFSLQFLEVANHIYKLEDVAKGKTSKYKMFTDVRLRVSGDDDDIPSFNEQINNKSVGTVGIVGTMLTGQGVEVGTIVGNLSALVGTPEETCSADKVEVVPPQHIPITETVPTVPTSADTMHSAEPLQYNDSADYADRADLNSTFKNDDDDDKTCSVERERIIIDRPGTPSHGKEAVVLETISDDLIKVEYESDAPLLEGKKKIINIHPWQVIKLDSSDKSPD